MMLGDKIMQDFDFLFKFFINTYVLQIEENVREKMSKMVNFTLNNKIHIQIKKIKEEKHSYIQCGAIPFKLS